MAQTIPEKLNLLCQPHDNSNSNKISDLAYKAIRLIFAGGLLGLLAFTAFTMYEKFLEIQLYPDLSGDGKFTIIDIPKIVSAILLEVGVRYQLIISDSRFGTFMEMSNSNPNYFWSLVLSILNYLSIYILFAVMFEYYPPKLDNLDEGEYFFDDDEL